MNNLFQPNDSYSAANPLNVKILRKLDKDSLLIEWGPPPSPQVVGFQVCSYPRQNLWQERVYVTCYIVYTSSQYPVILGYSRNIRIVHTVAWVALQLSECWKYSFPHQGIGLEFNKEAPSRLLKWSHFYLKIYKQDSRVYRQGCVNNFKIFHCKFPAIRSLIK